MPQAQNFNLIWDQVGQRWMETGVDRGVLYPMDANGNYTAGKAWNGLRTFDENPEGAEPQDFYADNILYASLLSAEKFKFDIGCYTYPKEWAECNGFASPIEGVQLGQQARKGFGFTCRTLLASDTSADSDAHYIIHIVYNATASPSQKSYETKNDSPAAVELTYSCTSKPTNVTGYRPVSCINIDTRLLSAEKLATLEAKLYGTAAIPEIPASGNDPAVPAVDAVPAALPTPDELLALLAA